jgi:hypothetical protein
VCFHQGPATTLRGTTVTVPRGRYQRKVLAAGRIVGQKMMGLRMMGPKMVGPRMVDQARRPSTNLR